MNNSSEVSVEAAIAAIGSKVTYTGAGGSVLGHLFSNEFAAVWGLAFALLGFILNWYYRHKADKRAILEHNVKMGKYE